MEKISAEVFTLKVFTYLGDLYHKKEIFHDALNEVLLKNLALLDLVKDQNIDLVLHEEPDLVVIGRSNLNEDNSRWLNELQVQVLTGYVKDGGKLFVWHAGLAGYPPDYTELVGGRFIFHPQRALVKYFSADGSSFEIVDEHYFVELRGNVEIFLWSESNCGRSTAGWKKRLERGKILALTPAHDEEGLNDERFRSLLVKSLRWFVEG